MSEAIFNISLSQKAAGDTVYLNTQDKMDRTVIEYIIGEIRKSPNAWIAIDELGDGWQFCSWPEYDVDLRNISKRFPHIIFTVYCCGHDAEDMWRHYFQNGRDFIAMANIEFLEFDEALLEHPQKPVVIRRSGELKCEKKENTRFALKSFFSAFDIPADKRSGYHCIHDEGHLWIINTLDESKYRVCDAVGSNCQYGFFFERVNLTERRRKQ